VAGEESRENESPREAGAKSERLLQDTNLSGSVGMGAAGPRLSASALHGTKDEGAGAQVREDHSWKSHSIEEGDAGERAGRAVTGPGQTGSRLQGALLQPIFTAVQSKDMDELLPANAAPSIVCRGKDTAIRSVRIAPEASVPRSTAVRPTSDPS
jgi:hypothetical protein